MISHPDFYTWNTENLHRMVEKIINAKSKRERPYYILVIIKKGYLGPPMKSRETQTMNLEGKTVFTQRIVLTDIQPARMIGTMCWRIDNKMGQAKCLWILPPDTPVLSTMDMDGESSLVAQSARGMPIVYNETN